MALEHAIVEFVNQNALLLSALKDDKKRFRLMQTRAGTDFPYAEFIILDDEVGTVTDGHSDEANALVQIDAFSAADDPESGIRLRDALFQELTHPTGVAGRNPFRGSFAGLHIVSCFRTGVTQTDGVPQSGQSNAPYQFSQDFEIGYYLDTDPVT